MAKKTQIAKIEINVSDSTSTEFHIDLSEEPISLANYDDDVDITWSITSTNGNWTFVKDTASKKKGIKIKKAGSAFAYHPTSSPKKVQRWKRTKRDGKKYKYTISIERPDGATITLDPMMIND